MRGFIFGVLIIIFFTLVFGVYAQESGRANFSLQTKTDVGVKEAVPVKLMVDATEESNLFDAELKFPPELLEVQEVNRNDSVVSQWVQTNFDNNAGTISIIGGVPNPGFKSSDPKTLAIIVFKPKAKGSADLSFGDNSAIYSNSSNQNILGSKTSVKFNVTEQSKKTTNKKLDLRDLSIVLSNYNKNFPADKLDLRYDFNEDGVVNSLDVSYLLLQLRKSGLIKV